MFEAFRRAAPLLLRPRSCGSAMFAGLALLAGCEDEDPPGIITLDGGEKPLDAALEGGLDARTDAASEASTSDADAQIPLGSECIIDGEALSVSIHETRERGWAAISNGTTVHLAYAVPTCTVMGSPIGSRLEYKSFASTGPYSQPLILAEDRDDACRTRRSPAFAFAASGAPDVYYTSSSVGAVELLRASVSAPHEVLRITADPETANDSELHTVAAQFGDTTVLAYVNQPSGVSPPSQLVTRRADREEIEIVPASAGQAPSRLALVAFPAAPIGGVVAWVSERADAFTLRGQPLDAEGAASGPSYELSSAVGGLSNIAIAATSERAAAVYTVQRGSVAELRYVPLDRNGRPASSPIELTSVNRSVSGVSIAPLANGFVVAFREVLADPSLPASLRLQFIADGRIAGERRLGDVARSGGASQLFVMNDGRLVVLWSDATATGSLLRAVRARCL